MCAFTHACTKSRTIGREPSITRYNALLHKAYPANPRTGSYKHNLSQSFASKEARLVRPSCGKSLLIFARMQAVFSFHPQKRQMWTLKSEVGRQMTLEPFPKTNMSEVLYESLICVSFVCVVIAIHANATRARKVLRCTQCTPRSVCTHQIATAVRVGWISSRRQAC